jgi:FAD/FMN-containing dehydrogenase
MALGVEVVLADGRILNLLSKLKKDNTGYDLRNLFIGAEGTLGIITAAALKLFPLPADVATALVGTDSPQHALDLLIRLRRTAGDQLTSFEMIPRRAVELTTLHIEGVANPLEQGTPWYLLIELSSPNPHQQLAALLAAQLEDALTDGIVIDATVATSLGRAAAMWKLRESVPEAQSLHGASLKHDISVPVSALPALVERGAELVRHLAPDGELIAYGHLGDGNLHFNVSQRTGSDPAVFLARKSALENAIFDLVGSLGGSFSAEHGIGRLKRAELARRADPVEYSVMRILKHALDPKGILNPGKVLI